MPRTWLLPRAAATGTLIGLFCAVTTTVTLSTLRPLFLGQALRLGLPDFDAAALQLARPRALTQAVSSLLYAASISGDAVFDGVQFQSRYGDDNTLIAIFERGADHDRPTGILNTSDRTLRPDQPDLVQGHGGAPPSMEPVATCFRIAAAKPHDVVAVRSSGSTAGSCSANEVDWARFREATAALGQLRRQAREWFRTHSQLTGR